MVEQFIYPVPEKFRNDPSVAEWFRALALWLDDVSSVNGVLVSSEETGDVVLTHSEKLDLVTVTKSVNLDDVVTTQDNMQNALVNLNVNNEQTNRTLNADAAAGAISVSPTQAQVENIRDAVLALADFVGTMRNDMKV